jgi:hypothetical protein
MVAPETWFMKRPGDADWIGVNPLCTRFVRPGQIEYLFPGDHSLDRATLFDSLDEHRCVAIVGPHGTGKSTFLHWWWKDRTDVRWIALSSGRLVGPHAPTTCKFIDRIKTGFTASLSTWKKGCQLLRSISDDPHSYWIVDGWEQMPLIIAIAIRWGLKRSSKRLVVTSHRDHFGIPTLHRTTVDDQVLWRILDHLLDMAPQTQAERIRIAARQRIAQTQIKNVREFLFDLYDVAGSSISPSKAPSTLPQTESTVLLENANATSCLD